ncbi:MAG: hypothetical protein Q7T63_16470, partial [Burkholderiaceae bacterium]|nr:hypothetical protein [Burkholderiaceae bacterium]
MTEVLRIMFWLHGRVTQMMKIFLAIATTLSLAACGAEPIWAPEAAVVASRYTHPGPTSVTLYTVLSTRNGSGAHA